jgi:hypothetical protein
MNEGDDEENAVWAQLNLNLIKLILKRRLCDDLKEKAVCSDVSKVDIKKIAG